MTNRSTTGSTALPTAPPGVTPIVVLTIEIKGQHCRLRAAGAPLNGVRKMHEWRFTTGTLTAPLLNEIGATMDSLSVAALLMAVGIQGELALALLEPPGPA